MEAESAFVWAKLPEKHGLTLASYAFLEEISAFVAHLIIVTLLPRELDLAN